MYEDRDIKKQKKVGVNRKRVHETLSKNTARTNLHALV